MNLAAAKLIMEAHEGKIEVYNLKEGGAGVKICFRSSRK
jgi:nitrogen fixation/metabolism regulation signal transduction histidine kinase